MVVRYVVICSSTYRSGSVDGCHSVLLDIWFLLISVRGGDGGGGNSSRCWRRGVVAR